MRVALRDSPVMAHLPSDMQEVERGDTGSVGELLAFVYEETGGVHNNWGHARSS